MGDFSFGSEPLLEQQLLSLERMLKDQHEFHKWQLASFMEANTSLREENTALPNVATAIPRPDDATATHHLEITSHHPLATIGRREIPLRESGLLLRPNAIYKF